MSIATAIVTQADAALSRMHRKLKRYLERGRIAKKKELQLTLGKAYERAWNGFPCVFALSTGRTGTQTMASMLSLSPQVLAQHEPAPRLVRASYEAFMDEQEGWMERWQPFALAVRDDFVLEASAEGRVYVESNNRITYMAPAFAAAFPDSRFIFSHRDPYQVIRSGMQRGAYQGGNMAWNFARIHPRTDDPAYAAWDSYSNLQREAWRWARINGYARAFFDTLPEERRLDLPARAFFSNDMEIYRKLFAFVGVPCPDEGAIRAVTGKQLNAQAHFDGLDFEWTDALRAEVRPIVQPVAEALGYTV
ncbi:MAG: sulfotransferase [Rhodothermales bacterium]|nr:sulfotransferase [Rhodothermales bacterium]